MAESIKAIVDDIINSWDKDLKVEKIEAITPDASLRRYFRLYFDSASIQKLGVRTAILMYFDSIAPAEIGSSQQIMCDEAYVELTKFFGANSVSVPKIYFDARDKSALVIEDVGRTALGSLIDGQFTSDLKSEEITAFYKQAIDELINFQKINKDLNCFAFRREFSNELLVKEMKEFSDFFLKLKEGPEKETFDNFYFEIAKLIAKMPKVLGHRDFHSWNLMIDLDLEPHQRKIRVIDFQDALVAPRAYDIVGLLNDRDTDSLLGKERHSKLLEYYLGNYDDKAKIYQEYLISSLQRDLKVVGRFSKFEIERGLTNYKKWIPGTFNRIKNTLEQLKKEGAYLELFADHEAANKISQMVSIHQGENIV